ncbi:hypothetical protein SNE40_013908 [Patella caerulea]|uniref:Uncharacterized protein n=1 Tax=Patella caerulea TaxID=87958 RepID=A0AAN8JH62_PATCE
MKIVGTLLVTLVVCLCINGLFGYPTTSKYTSYTSKNDLSTINYGTNKYFNTKYYGPSPTAQYRWTTQGHFVRSTPRNVKTTAKPKKSWFFKNKI